MKYINTKTLEYPFTESQIRKLNPQVSFPKPFKAAPYAVVFTTPKPATTVIERALEVKPVFTDKNIWEQQWGIVPAFTEYTDEDDVVHTVAEQEAEATAKELLDGKAQRASTNKADCTSHILAQYPEPIQRSALMGIYSAAYITTMADFIAACVVEENRVFDLIEAATTMAELNLVKAPIWPKGV